MFAFQYSLLIYLLMINISFANNNLPYFLKDQSSKFKIKDPIHYLELRRDYREQRERDYLGGFEGSGGGVGYVELIGPGKFRVLLKDLTEKRLIDPSKLLNKQDVILEFHNSKQAEYLFKFEINNYSVSTFRKLFFKDAIKLVRNSKDKYPLLEKIIPIIEQTPVISYQAYLNFNSLNTGTHYLAYFKHGTLFVNNPLYMELDKVGQTGLSVHELLRLFNLYILKGSYLTTDEIEIFTRDLLGKSIHGDDMKPVLEKMNKFLKNVDLSSKACIFPEIVLPLGAFELRDLIKKHIETNCDVEYIDERVIDSFKSVYIYASNALNIIFENKNNQITSLSDVSEEYMALLQIENQIKTIWNYARSKYSFLEAKKNNTKIFSIYLQGAIYLKKKINFNLYEFSLLSTETVINDFIYGCAKQTFSSVPYGSILP